MKIDFGEIQRGFLFTMSYTKQKTSSVDNEEGEKVGVKTPLIFIENNPRTTVLTMVKQFNITQKTIERWIKTLREENKIEFKDALKIRGYWKIKHVLHMHEKNLYSPVFL
jgi:ATP-dependent DNA helicase RecG